MENNDGNLFLFEAIFANPIDYLSDYSDYRIYVIAFDFGSAATKAENEMAILKSAYNSKKKKKEIWRKSGNIYAPVKQMDVELREYQLKDLRKHIGEVVI
jgi:hypothetical protein